MLSSRRITTVVAVSVIGFQACAALTARLTIVPYDRAALGAFFLEAILGVVIAQSQPEGAFRAATIAGLIVAVINATIGRAVASAVAPRLGIEFFGRAGTMTVLGTIAWGLVLTLVGAVIGTWKEPAKT